MPNVPGYQIEELLSWGSQGDVFRGVDGKGQVVALKIVTADRTDGDPRDPGCVFLGEEVIEGVKCLIYRCDDGIEFYRA